LWINQVKPCPCDIICYKTTTFYDCRNGRDIVEIRSGQKVMPCNTSPKNFEWGNAFPIVNYFRSYHPKGEYELRSKGVPGKPGAQCIYDGNGKLMTKPPGAGSADRSSPTPPLGGKHVDVDVNPFDCARELDKGGMGYSSLPTSEFVL